MKPKAIYAGSFDPIHYGHLDIIERAAKLFDLTVLIANNPAKKYSLKWDTRVNLVKSHVPKDVKVAFLPGGLLLADYAYNNGIKLIIKGVRTFQDYDYERLLHEITISQLKGIETFPMISQAKYIHVSSTACRELGGLFANTSDYMPVACKEAMEIERFNVRIVGVTGLMGSGKSTLCKHFAAHMPDVVHIDADKLAHNVLNTPPVPLMNWLMDHDINPTSPHLRTVISDKIFTNPSHLESYSEMMYPLVFAELKQQVFDIAHNDRLNVNRKTILVESALIPSNNLYWFCNNRIIYVDTSPELCSERAVKRGGGWDKQQIGTRLAILKEAFHKMQEEEGLKIVKIYGSEIQMNPTLYPVLEEYLNQVLTK